MRGGLHNWVMACLRFALPLIFAAVGFGQAPQIQIRVDATDAPRRLIHAELHFPVKAGPLSLLYPKWIPGEHGPTGPIVDLAGLKISGNGKPISWRRDDVEIYEFHVDVPAGVSVLDVSPMRMTASVINRYLEIKGRGVL